MPFSHILGQDTAIATLGAALRGGRVHHAYRFEGPDGVGKEMVAFALAQALVCMGGDALGCGVCDACRRAVTLAAEKPLSPLHPDVSIVEKNFYPPEVIGRSRPELTEISVDQIRKIVLARSSFPPHEGRARVVIVRRAEELSISAANAFLKTLEEPRQKTHFILLTARPDRLIDTIRSRTLPLRFAPLSAAILRGILQKCGIPEARHDLAVELAGGSAQLALDLADEDATRDRDAFVERVFAAMASKDLGAAVALAESDDRARDDLRRELRALAAAFATKGRKLALEGGASSEAQLAAERYRLVAEAATNLDKNASPGLTLTALVQSLRTAVA